MHGVIHALGLRMLTWALLMCTALVSGREEAMLVVQGKPYCSRGIPCQCLPAVYTCPLYGTAHRKYAWHPLPVADRRGCLGNGLGKQ